MKNILLLLTLLISSTSFSQDVKVDKIDNTTYQVNIKGGKKAISINDFEVSTPEYCFENSAIDVTVTALNSKGETNTRLNGNYTFSINRESNVLKFKKGVATTSFSPKKSEITVKNVETKISKTASFRIIYGWMTILPPLIAIFFALLTRQVLLSLFLGIFSGSLILNGLKIKSFFMIIEEYGMNALNDSGHLSIIIFSTIIGGMVAIISKNGGMAGVVDKLSKYATSVRSTQFITWFLGVAIFFDDYANTLVVGNTMKSVTDKYKISREKLAYLVDSTAAPVAAIAFITTWIGAELGYIEGATKTLGINEGAYSIFLGSLKYAFYPIFTLSFMLILIWMQKDFGPMKTAEDNARAGNTNKEDIKVAESEEFEPIDLTKTRWFNAFIPVFVLIGSVLVGLWLTGTDATAPEELAGLGFFRKLGVIIGNSDSYIALLWASLASIATAIILTISQKIMTLDQTMESALGGFKSMTTAMIILICAWALASITEDLHTADFLTSLFTGNVSSAWMPTITFILAGAVAFSTGSSWGTMAILYPLILPTTWSICQAAGMPTPEAMEVIYHVTAVVIAGSVFGDHCSPISDTTILSSLSSGCNHIEHVRTQMPYALVTGGVSIIASLVLVNIGLPWYLSYLIGIGLLVGVVKILGK